MASTGIDRRLFLQMIGALALASSACGSGDATPDGADGGPGAGAGPGSDAGAEGSAGAGPVEEFEYVVVGSGAGGGPLAANLARQGHTVLLLEAGEDRGGQLDVQVPAFHPQSTEDKTMRWDYFVKHYDDAAKRNADSKVTAAKDGVLYPRAGTLGGCTAHNAMITVYPHEADWDEIATATGDTSWSAAQMRRYFEILERCGYLGSGDATDGHGFKGWLPTHRASTTLLVGDVKTQGVLLAGASEVNGFTGTIGSLYDTINADLNAAAPGRDGTEGMFTIPLATDGQRRFGPREYLLDTVAQGHPLSIRTHALASRVLWADATDPAAKLRAIGVEYLEGAHLYRADPNAPATGTPGLTRRVHATREVILCAGAFNTPQLLKLSGVGPKDELTKLGIDVKIDLPGVGANLQDRYEVGVVTEFGSDLVLLDGCTFGVDPDPCLVKWQSGSGVYTSNGGVAGIVKKSSASVPLPDLFVFLLPGYFKGYEPGYSTRISADHRHYTWAVLKAHTGNHGGLVTLRTADPRDVPEVRFRYFEEGTNDAGQAQADLDAVVAGVEMVRSINSRAKTTLFLETLTEIVPGPAVSDKAGLADFVKREAWGHHASCTCKIGADGDPMAVLDSRFRVRGTSSLRVVDASVFPKIPGFFIVAPIYMVSEKATDVLLADIGETRS